MGNEIIHGKIKGITNYYAKMNIGQYNEGGFLFIEPEFENQYDSNALCIYDRDNNKLGYVDKNQNVVVYNRIRDKRYFCLISKVYKSYDYPGIEYSIFVETNTFSSAITPESFEKTYGDYKAARLHKDNSVMNFLADKFDSEVQYSDEEQIMENYDVYASECWMVESIEDTYFYCRKINGRIVNGEISNIMPQGFKRIELALGRELDDPDNDSYDDEYLDYVYDIIEPKIKEQFRGIPFYFENMNGLVALYLRLDYDHIDGNTNFDKMYELFDYGYEIVMTYLNERN